jgi:hypothetical protein
VKEAEVVVDVSTVLKAKLSKKTKKILLSSCKEETGALMAATGKKKKKKKMDRDVYGPSFF